MRDRNWTALAARLGFQAREEWAEGHVGAYPAGVTCRGESTWLGLVVGNPDNHEWTLTRRWEPQARNPRRPDERTVRFRDVRLTERYVGSAGTPTWFRESLTSDTIEALVAAADRNRLGSCALELRGHLLTARYRASVDAIPDLPETLASLGAVAKCLDGDSPERPDVSVSPLAAPKAHRNVLTATQAAFSGTTLVCGLPKHPGLRRRFQAAPQAVFDWTSGRVTGLETAFPLACIRQVLVATLPEAAQVEFIDKAGATAAVLRIPSGVTPPPDLPDPPVVCVSADREVD